MRIAIQISAIDREHLQELYEAAAVGRDALPYTQAFEQLWHDFQDRTFKNADRSQVYAALLKHVRSSAVASGDLAPSTLEENHLNQLRNIARRYTGNGPLLPYSVAISLCRAEFARATQIQMNERDFWIELLHARGTRRRVPPRRPMPAHPPEPAPATPGALPGL